jgi:hypothetical protein
MLERYNPVLKIVCVALALLVLYQLARALTRKDPLGNIGLATTQATTGRQDTNVSVKGTNSTPRSGAAKSIPPLEPGVQARIDRIAQSEILGAVVVKKALPMALLGIGGKDAFLRAPNGQTGLLREGEELGGLKLLRIGTNRVLVEHENQQKELTLFSGFGSETLLPKKEKTPP